MKFLRLTSQDPDAIFDCDINDGFTLPPNSQIALQSVSANLEGGAIEVDDTNNGITYEIQTNDSRTVDLTHQVYNKANTMLLLKDIRDTLNKDAVFTAGRNKVLGLEWNCFVDGNGLVSTGYKIGRAGDYYDNSDPNDSWHGNEVQAKDVGTQEQNMRFSQLGTNTPTSNFNHCWINNHPVSRGNGYVRAHIGLNTDTGNNATNGMIIGFTKQPVQPEDFEERMCDYAIRITVDTATGNQQYFTLLDGVATLSAVVPQNAGGNDTVEITKDGNSIKLNAYTVADDGTATNLATYGLPNPIDTPLYVFMCFFGASTNSSLDDIRFTPSPWAQIWEDKTYNKPVQPVVVSLHSIPTNGVPIKKTENFIQFESGTLSRFLGYAFRRNPPFGNELVAEPLFIGDTIFSIGLSLNSFIIQMLNLKVDSYDSLKQQRENILAVVPSGDTSGDIDYSPPELFFIDLLNKEPLLVRNIKMRIVNSDYSPLAMEGSGFINILIK